jgi:hypothetical protein
MNLLFLLLFLFPSGVSGSRAGPSTQMPVALLLAPMVLLWVLVDVVSDELWRGFVFRIRRQPLLMHWCRLGRGSVWSNIPSTLLLLRSGGGYSGTLSSKQLPFKWRCSLLVLDRWVVRWRGTGSGILKELKATQTTRRKSEGGPGFHTRIIISQLRLHKWT